MNNTTEEIKPEPQLSYAVTYGFIMSIGFPLNAIAIWIFLRHHCLKSPNVIFLLNLAISDLLLTCSLPLKVYFFVTGTWPFGDTVCILAQAFFHFNIRSSALFITLISVDRLLAVVYPLRSRHFRIARNAVIAAALVWLFVIIIAIPVSISFGKESKEKEKSYCFEHPRHQHKPELKFAVGILRMTLILVLLIVNVVCTVLVSLTLRRNVKDLPKVNSKINVLLLFVMNLIMFTVFFLPTSTELLIEGRLAYVQCIAAANCCLDPLLYYFSLDAFWKKKEELSQQKLQEDV